MSKLADQLREHRIFNTWELLKRFGDKGTDVAVSYHPPEARACRSSGTKVWSPTFKTDADAAWYDYHSKTFCGRRKESFPEAKAWASEQYGIMEWVADPTDRSTHIPKYVLDRAKKFLKENSNDN